MLWVAGRWLKASAQVLPCSIFRIGWCVLIVVLIVLGFPVALTLSWFFDLTRYGIVRTPDRATLNRVDVVEPSISAEKSLAVLPFNNLSPEKMIPISATALPRMLLGALAK